MQKFKWQQKLGRGDADGKTVASRRVMRLLKGSLHILAVLVFISLLLVLLLAAIPFSEDGQDHDDIYGSSPPLERLGVLIIYPKRDSWGADAADYLSDALLERYDIDVYSTNDCDFIHDDTSLTAFNNATLTVVLGVTDLLDENYLEVLSRVGYEGLEIKVETRKDVGANAEDTLQYLEDEDGNIVAEGLDSSATSSIIEILSPSYGRVCEGIDSFLSAFYTDGYHYRIKRTLSESELMPPQGELLVSDQITLEDGRLDVLTVSYIDGNSYTLRALEVMVDETKPDMVLFNGNVDCGAKTRSELADAWRAVSSILCERDIPWMFMPGDLKSSHLSRITVLEVISSFDGCLLPLEADDTVEYVLTVNDADGMPSAMVIFADTGADMYALCDIIEADIPLYARLIDREIPLLAFMPSLPSCLTETIVGGESNSALTDLYNCLIENGAEFIVCSTSPTVSRSYTHASGTTVSLCGSLGFDAPGLGGRFEYNNSERCSLLLSLEIRRSTAADISLRRLIARELGLNMR